MSFEEHQVGDCRLILGDCREVLAGLPANSVDAVVTDPPYGVAFTGKHTQTAHRGGRIKQESGYLSLPDTPLYVQQVVIPAIELCRTLAPAVTVTPGTRNLWLYPPAEDVGCFFSAAGTGMGRWGFTCMQPILYYGKDPYLARGMGSRPNSHGKVYPNDANKQAHPCAKPLPMMLWLVNRASLEGMTILDPFAGSFTTGLACLRLGRPFTGIEIERRYFDLGCARLEAAYAAGLGVRA
jgi:DNA modification methylase